MNIWKEGEQRLSMTEEDATDRIKARQMSRCVEIEDYIVRKIIHMWKKIQNSYLSS